MHCNHIKARLQVFQMMPAEVVQPQLAQLALFALRDGQERMQSTLTARFHFAEDEMLIVLRDDVDLSEPTAKVPLQHGQALPGKVFAGGLLSGGSETLPGFCHNKSSCTGRGFHRNERRWIGLSPYRWIASRCFGVG